MRMATKRGDADAAAARASKEVARAIADAVKSFGLTQAALSVRLKISQARVSQLLSGRSNPTIRTLARIADELGLKLNVSLAPIKENDE